MLQWHLVVELFDDLVEGRRMYGVWNIHCTASPCPAHPSPPGRGFFINESLAGILTKRAGNIRNCRLL
jgi:hypothetical protein